MLSRSCRWSGQLSRPSTRPSRSLKSNARPRSIIARCTSTSSIEKATTKRLRGMPMNLFDFVTQPNADKQKDDLKHPVLFFNPVESKVTQKSWSHVWMRSTTVREGSSRIWRDRLRTTGRSTRRWTASNLTSCSSGRSETSTWCKQARKTHQTPRTRWFSKLISCCLCF